MKLPDLTNPLTPLELAIEKATGKPVQKKMGKSKYGAIKTEVDGIVFDSKGESRRYIYLKELVEKKIIDRLELQPSFPVIFEGKKKPTCIVKADFAYRVIKTGKVNIEDFKGKDTPISRLKRKLIRDLYGIEILVIKKPKEGILI